MVKKRQYESLLILPEFFVVIKQDAWPIPLQNLVHVLWPVDVYQNRNKTTILLESFCKTMSKIKSHFFQYKSPIYFVKIRLPDF